MKNIATPPPIPTTANTPPMSNGIIVFFAAAVSRLDDRDVERYLPDFGAGSSSRSRPALVSNPNSLSDAAGAGLAFSGTRFSAGLFDRLAGGGSRGSSN